MASEIEKLDLASEDLVGGRVEELLRLFPEAATEGTGRIDFERLRLALGDEVAEDDERYAFTWPGKRAAIRQAQAPSHATLRPAPEESVDWDTTENLYIEGDNLEVLKLLQRSYHGRVKLIYIDPPYNTGHDFVYEDSFGDSIANYKEQAGLSGQANPDTSGRYHSRWCSMMYPRLKLARELLREDGVLALNIGEDEIDNLAKICDELFGRSNRITIFSRAMKSGGAKGSFYTPSVDYILVYAKDVELASHFRAPFTQDQIDVFYKYTEETGELRGEAYGIERLFKASLDPRPNQRYYIQCPDGSYVIPPGPTMPKECIEGLTVLPTSQDKVWKWIYPRYKQELEAGRIVFKQTTKSGLVDQNGNQAKWNIYNKMYLSEQVDKGGVVPSNLITAYENRQSAKELAALGIPFDYAKPLGLIKYFQQIVGVGSTDIVLDFFSGSATTADAVMQLNAEDGGKRKFIMVQLPEACAEGSEAAKAGYATIAEIGKERIRRAGTKIAAEVEEANRQLALGQEPRPVPDVGFRVFKLDESGIARPAGTLEESIVGADRSQLDIVFELMLKWGLDLTLPVERIECAGYPCWSVAAGELICCLDQGLTMEALHAVAELGPRRVLLLDSILTDTLKLNALQIFAHAAERLNQPIDLRTV